MAYWWVSQNQTYRQRQERSGGYLWAPNRTEAGLTPFHWATMNEVRPGDLIFSYVGGKIVAVAVAKTAAYDSPRPRDMGEGLWEDEGKRVDVEYRDLSIPLAIPDVLSIIQPLLPDRYSPLTRFGTGNQGYLFALPPRAGRFLLDRIGDRPTESETGVVEAAISSTISESTVRRAVILSRVGQGQFREALLGLWDGRCAVTGLDLPLLLRASHIKPWRAGRQAPGVSQLPPAKCLRGVVKITLAQELGNVDPVRPLATLVSDPVVKILLDDVVDVEWVLAHSAARGVERHDDSLPTVVLHQPSQLRLTPLV